MKFGGTSVEDAVAMKNVIAIVARSRSRRPVVVLSAAARVTNTLIDIADAATCADHNKVQELVDGLEHRHFTIAKDLLKNYSDVEERLGALFSELRTLSQGVVILGELSPRSLDAFLSFGERFSTLIFAAALSEQEYPVVLVDARNIVITDDEFNHARPIMDRTEEAAKKNILPHLNDGKVVVTQGFIGGTVDGITTTVGRGGSDYTASIIGVALGVEEIEIWTDVDGILSADPSIIKNAHPIEEMSFDEASELAYFGARVLHPETILPAVAKNIPVRVLNSKRADSQGTRIVRESRDKRPVKSVAYKEGITLIGIRSSRMFCAVDFLKAVFDVFEKYETVCHTVATSEVSVSMTIDNVGHLTEITEELSRFANVNVVRERALVCVVGSNLKTTPGIVPKIFQAIGNVDINMISQGSSEINLSFVVPEEAVNEVVGKLHKEFFER